MFNTDVVSDQLFIETDALFVALDLRAEDLEMSDRARAIVGLAYSEFTNYGGLQPCLTLDAELTDLAKGFDSLQTRLEKQMKSAATLADYERLARARDLVLEARAQ